MIRHLPYSPANRTVSSKTGQCRAGHGNRSANGQKLSHGLVLVSAAGALFGATGCAFHYYDAASQTDHVIGFGHMSLRVIDKAENVQALVKGTTVVGFKVGAGLDNYSIGAGYDSGYRVIIQTNDVALRLEWPNAWPGARGYNLRLGTAPPFAPSMFTNLNPPYVSFPAVNTNPVNPTNLPTQKP